MESAALTKQDIYKIKQGYKYTGENYWNWWVWIEAPEADLDKIAHVTYILHPSFFNPVRDVKDRSSKFQLKTSGWGTFTLHAKIHLKTGKEINLEHDLELEYPDTDDIKVLSSINISGRNDHPSIEIMQGDLTAIPKKHAADILVISAYPGSYEPRKNTLMESLYNKGINVAEMAKDKEIDLVDKLDCWLSKPLTAEKQDELNFKRILCFEPKGNDDDKSKMVENIFRCINTFAFDKGNNVIAMPVLASGNQKVKMQKMLPAILDASIFWLENGLPIQCIKLFLYTDEQVATALPIFTQSKEQYELKKSIMQGSISSAEGLKLFNVKSNAKDNTESDMPIIRSEITDLAVKESEDALKLNTAEPQIAKSKQTDDAEVKEQYDFFISYASAQTNAVTEFVKALKEKDPSKKVFYDKSILPAGDLWIKQISDAIQNSRQVICILSPQYASSAFCWDEFQVAKAKEFRTKKSVIRTILFLSDPNMPLLMSVYSYIDCTEGDIEKLKHAVEYFLT